MSRMTKIYFIVATLFLSLLLFTSQSYALPEPSRRPIRPPLPSVSQRQTGQTRRDDARLKACQAKEAVIKKRSSQLTKLATTMQEKFDAIAKRVEEYYTTKVVPSGKTVANYDSLISDIQTKKGVVQTALTQAQSNASSFACNSNDPKGQVLQFKDDMQAVKTALKDYRTSIKNLIVTVHSVTGVTERSNTTSPKPTKTGGENE